MTTNQTKFTISCKLIYFPIKSCLIVVLFLIYFYRSGSRTPQQPSSNSGRTKAAQQALQTGSYGSSGTGNALFRNRSHTVSGLSPARSNDRGGNCNSFFRISGFVLERKATLLAYFQLQQLWIFYNC